MNFDKIINDIERRQKNLEGDIQAVKISLKKAESFTDKFLKTCNKRGIDKVSISIKHESIPSTESWPFGYEGSVFGMGEGENGWPAIWGVVEELKIGGGCGNRGQHSADTNNLIDGVYHLNAGKWLKVK